MPRPERPIPDGPLAKFASGLRALRHHAGLTYRELSRRTHYAPSVLATAAAGEVLPTWPVTAAYVKQCGGSVQIWRRHWEELATQHARQARPRSTPSHSAADLTHTQPFPRRGYPPQGMAQQGAAHSPTPYSSNQAKPPTAIRVLIVDDHGLWRCGLRATLAMEPDIDVVGEAGDGADAFIKTSELHPDVVLMDVKMPRQDGIEACRTITQAVPNARVVMLTVSEDENDLYQAVQAGASGYLLKQIPVDELATSIRAVHEGHSLIDPALADKLLNEFATRNRRTTSQQPTPPPKLTGREMEVLQAIVRGRNNREIAKDLFISENTVRNHIRNILEKLQLHSRTEAVIYAVREKWLEIT